MARRFVSMVLVILLLVAAMVTRAGSPAAHADIVGNAGDTKISQFTYPDVGLQGNDPHVACAFYVLGFNFAAAQGTNTIVSWSPTGDDTTTVVSWTPTGDRTTVVSDSYTGTPDGSGTFQFVNGPYYLNPGHYKNYVTDNKGTVISKQKVFWVDGPCSPPPPPCTGTTCGAIGSVTLSHQTMNLAHVQWRHVAKTKRH